MRHSMLSPLAQRAKLARELGTGFGAQSRVERAFDVDKQRTRALVGGMTARRDGRADGAAVLRIGDAGHETVRLEAIHQLRHVGLAAAMPLGELREGERLRRQHEVAQRTELGERESYFCQGAFGTRLHGTGCVEKQKSERALWGSGGAATV